MQAAKGAAEHCCRIHAAFQQFRRIRYQSRTEYLLGIHLISGHLEAQIPFHFANICKKRHFDYYSSFLAKKRLEQRPYWGGIDSLRHPISLTVGKCPQFGMFSRCLKDQPLGKTTVVALSIPGLSTRQAGLGPNRRPNQCYHPRQDRLQWQLFQKSGRH